MPVLRSCSGPLATALAAGPVKNQADLFTFVLQNTTTYRWTNWDSSLLVSGNTFLSSQPWLSRSRWNVTNTMEVPTLEVFIDGNETAGFGGGTASLRRQIINGLFDGATMSLQRVFMPTAGDTSTYGTIQLFKGDVGAATISGARATLKIRGKSSRLSVNAPRNVYQPGCLHTFCDPGCTLSAGAFTLSYTLLAGSSTTLLNVTPSTANQQLPSGTVTVTSGASAGLERSVIAVTTTGGLVPLLLTVTLANPLPAPPVAGDTFALFSGCDKTLATCVVVYANGDNFRGFPFMPAPDTAAPAT